MKCAFTAMLLALIISCGNKTPSQSLGGLGLVKVYAIEDHGEMTCDSLLSTLKSEGDIQGSLLSQSLSDFEVDGFATIQVPHVPCAKKFFVIVRVTDPDTGRAIGHGCAENIEVRKGAIRDVPIILQAPLPREAE